MSLVLIDVDELLALSSQIARDAVELEAMANGSTGWLTPDGGDPLLAAVRSRIAGVVSRLWFLGESVASVSLSLASGAAAGLTSEGMATPFAGALQLTTAGQWPPLLQGILGQPAGVPSTGFSDFLSTVTATGLLGQSIGANGFGMTTNQGLNALLGSATAAQGFLSPLGILPSSVGGDLNAQALAISANIGVGHALAGTGPLFANGAIAGMHNSLGITFPAAGDGTTIGWALGLLDADGGGGPSSGGSMFQANPFFNNPVGSVGQPLTQPIISRPDTVPGL
jgi:hypothetical protein